ncbi:MAG: peptide chain release factor-like protein, partial [Candidatus Sumerlaeia bacterium]|nr:peptide chain release factor-like protein [Candidatus Sumerlaeia bacterium]
CQRERSQYRNKQLALEMLRRRLERMNRRERPRVATKVPRRVKEKILTAKRQLGERKKLRRRPRGEED